MFFSQGEWVPQNTPSFGAQAASVAAGALASAATQSAIEGSSFGKNLLAAIPNVAAQVLVGGILSLARGGSSMHLTGVDDGDNMKKALTGAARQRASAAHGFLEAFAQTNAAAGGASEQLDSIDAQMATPVAGSGGSTGAGLEQSLEGASTRPRYLVQPEDQFGNFVDVLGVEKASAGHRRGPRCYTSRR